MSPVGLEQTNPEKSISSPISLSALCSFTLPSCFTPFLTPCIAFSTLFSFLKPNIFLPLFHISFTFDLFPLVLLFPRLCAFISPFISTYSLFLPSSFFHLAIPLRQCFSCFLTNPNPSLPCFSSSFFTCSLSRGPEAALLRILWSGPVGYPHSLYQPLPGPGHHLYHLYQCHHHVSGALQPATGDHTSWWICRDGPCVGVGVRQTQQTCLSASEWVVIHHLGRVF